jgi:hypothetical protein
VSVHEQPGAAALLQRTLHQHRDLRQHVRQPQAAKFACCRLLRDASAAGRLAGPYMVVSAEGYIAVGPDNAEALLITSDRHLDAAQRQDAKLRVVGAVERERGAAT